MSATQIRNLQSEIDATGTVIVDETKALAPTALGASRMSTDLAAVYRDYIACLNCQDWPNLHLTVQDEVRHNGRPFGLSGYRAMLERDFAAIPDLHFNIALLISDSTTVAARLHFDCTPTGNFLGLAVNGKRVTFDENVFYEFRDGKIDQVWSVIDKSGISAQL